MTYRQQGKQIILTDRGTNQQTLSTSRQAVNRQGRKIWNGSNVKARKIYPKQSRRQRNLQHCTDKNEFKKAKKFRHKQTTNKQNVNAQQNLKHRQ